MEHAAMVLATWGAMARSVDGNVLRPSRGGPKKPTLARSSARARDTSAESRTPGRRKGTLLRFRQLPCHTKEPCCGSMTAAALARIGLVDEQRSAPDIREGRGDLGRRPAVVERRKDRTGGDGARQGVAQEALSGSKTICKRAYR